MSARTSEAEVAHLRSMVVTLEVRLQLLSELYQGALRRELVCEKCEDLEKEATALRAAADSEFRLRKEGDGQREKLHGQLMAEIARRTGP